MWHHCSRRRRLCPAGDGDNSKGALSCRAVAHGSVSKGASGSEPGGLFVSGLPNLPVATVGEGSIVEGLTESHEGRPRMYGLEGLRMPREYVELGTPQRVYRSNQVSRSTRWSTNIFGTLFIVAGLAALYLVALARLIPDEPKWARIVTYIAGFVLLAGGMM